jgi:membrane-associated protease RseP (regulator of RpoE activity)
VTTASAAQQAGIVAGDRLLMINGRTVNSEAAARTAFNGASSPAFVVVERDGQRIGVFLSTK